MKQLKKHSCLTLFSVGILASQFLVSPILLAEESQYFKESYIDTSKDGEETEESQESIMLESTEDSKPSEEQNISLIEEQKSETIEPSFDSENASEQETLDRLEDEQASDIDDDKSEKKDEQASEINDDKTEKKEEANVESEGKEVPDVESVDKVEEKADNESPSTTEPIEDTNKADSSNPADEGQYSQPSSSPEVQAPNGLPSLIEGFYDGEMTVNLPDSFRASEAAQSTLLGFALPLLSEYEEQWQAALLYEVIRHIGESSDQITLERWVEEIVSKVIGESSQWATFEKDKVSLQPGDLLVEAKGEIVGIYLSEGYQASLSEDTHQSQQDEKKSSKISIEVQHTDLDEIVLIKRLEKTDLTEYGKRLVQDYPAPYDFNVNLTTQKFIDTIAKDAQRLGQEYDVFASVLIAQAILESGSGGSGLSNSPHHNLFGIKGSHQGKSVVLPTTEDKGNGELFEIQAAFRSYGSYRDSMADYVKLIRGGITGNSGFYQDVWRSEAKNYLRATDALTGSYATDVNYNKKLNSLIAAYRLTQFDQALGTETGVFIQGKNQIPEEYRKLMQFPEYNGRDYNYSGSYPVGQCTWYVFNRVSQLGGVVDDYMGNGGQWGATGRRLGYTVSQKPKAGSMISFAPGTAGSDPRYGHVAFVEAVGTNGILISEGNVYGGTTISYRVISNDLALSNHVSYIMPK